jgi:hypothetical protein
MVLNMGVSSRDRTWPVDGRAAIMAKLRARAEPPKRDADFIHLDDILVTFGFRPPSTQIEKLGD